MKLNKKQEAEVLKFYHDYWEVYLAGDIKSFAAALDDTVTITGTAISEIFHNKKQTVRFYKDTVDQMTNTVQLRNRKISVQPVGNTVIIREQMDFYTLLDEKWTFYGHGRLSAVLIQTKKGWKLVHQHASFPDSRAEEGEQMASKQIAAENLKLREAVERHTVELREKNRELEIETALEKVRAIAMGMKEAADMLDISKTISQELNRLGVKAIRNIQTAIIYEQKKKYLNYEFYTKHNKLLITEADYSNHSMSKAFAKKMLSGPNTFFRKSLKGKKVQEWYAFQKTTNQFADKYLAKATSLNYYWYSLGPVALGISTYEPLDKTEQELFIRFRNVFELAYRRYMDIEKSFAQAREAQIELALERVRARTMAMQKSDELADVAGLLFKQVNDLGIKTWTTGFNVWSEDNNFYTDYITSPQGGFVTPYTIDARSLPVGIKLSTAKKSGQEFYVNYEEGEALAETYRMLLSFGEKQFTSFLSSGFEFPTSQYEHFVFGSKVSLMFITYDAVPEAHDIFKRFGKVFEQTYTRFLDLQKAEAQAREAQIEAALEKVRSRSLAMHNSSELPEVAATLFEKLRELSFSVSEGAVSILIFKEGSRDHTQWIADPAHIYPDYFFMPYSEHTLAADLIQAKESGVEYFSKLYPFKEKNDYFNYLFQHSGYNVLPDEIKQLMLSSEQYGYSIAFAKNSAILIPTTTGNLLTADEADTLKKFSRVFEQAYVRFLDLQTAEAQAREARIETALEKIRSRSLGMHRSAEIKHVVSILFEKLKELDLAFDGGAAIHLFHEDSGNAEIWVASPDLAEPTRVNLPYDEKDFDNNPIINDVWNAKKNGGHIYNKSYSLEEKNRYFDYVFKHNDLITIPKKSREFILHAKSYTASFIAEKNSLLGANSWTGQLFSENDFDVLKRIARVFEQAYIRFLDLQKAEAQARKAQIEAALERVRSVAMSMMKSEDLMTICKSVFTQLQALGFNDLRAAQIYIRNDDEKKFMNYDYSDDTGADTVEVNYNSHPYTTRIYDVIRNAGDGLIHNTISKKELDEWKSYLYDTLGQPPEKSLEIADELHYYLYSFGIGAFGICTFKTINKEELEILKRFRNVFNLSYQRYSDIALAEAQAREAQIEAALERVRSRTLAMQKSDELPETAAVLFKQLIGLNIAPNRLYIGIINNDYGEIEFWVTDEDGSKISAMFSGNAYKNISVKKMYDGWKTEKKSLIIDMQGEELAEYFHYLGDELHVPFKTGLSRNRRLQYISYFPKGFIGMASPDEQPAETIILLERFAYVFNLTFTRFNDLKLAEAHALQAEEDLIKLQTEKKRAEEALTELRATQTQLIQSEKMASLGQLTAGIAHEIQNPLNFVNNFSEVSEELIKEMMEEADKGNIQEVKNIAADLVQNLGKIYHHGKRADSIVKGMLEHSRTSAGNIQPTDINALADEYLRLSYHGLRAKDAQHSANKSFNTIIHTDFDNSIGAINIVGQDIARVLLNLYNNAFYAVNEKAKQNITGYEQSVSVSTKKIGDKIEIKVRDNGNGIPLTIIDKIFQPFFTTKPTGQGTGLGLSLAYDIIKAHGGKIKVETKEGEGSGFVIELPIA